MDLTNTINIITESVSAVLYLALFLVSCVLYFGRGGFNLFHHLTCFKLTGKMDQRTKSIIRSRLALYVLITLFSFFLISRAVGGVLFAVNFALKSEIFGLFSSVKIVDYFGFLLFIPIFSAMIVVWLQIGVVWTQNSKIIRVIVLMTLVVCNSVVGLLFVAISALQLLRQIIGETNFKIGQNYVAAPILFTVMAVLTVLTAILAVRVVFMLRRSAQYRKSLNVVCNNSESRDVYHIEQQHMAMIKCVVAVLTLNAALLVRAGGLILLAVDAPIWLASMLSRYLPDYLSALMILFVFWPFRLPSCSRAGKGLSFLDPIRFSQDKDIGTDTNITQSVTKELDNNDSSTQEIMACDDDKRDIINK